MKFKSSLGVAALEELNEAQAVANLTAATEGWKGAVGGFAAAALGFSVAGVGQIAVGAGLANEVEKKKAEIEKISREIEKAAMDNGKKAVSEGKLSAEDFKKEVSVGAKGVLRGAIYGTLFSGIYGAIKGSELEDLMAELKTKCAELDRILEKGKQTGEVTEKGVKGGAKPAAKPKAGSKVAKEDNEGEDDAAAAAAADDAGAAADPAADDTAAAAAAGDDAASAAGADDAAAAGADDATATTDDAGAAAAADDTGAATDDTAAAGADDTAGADDAAAVDPAVADDAGAAAAADSAVAQVDATGEAGEVVADAVPGDAEAEVVEEQMSEVDQIEDKTNDVNEDVEKLEAATESLEGCVAILDAAAQRGGLDIFGASLLRNNINTVTGSLKVKPLMLPALEDMETPSSKIDGANSAKDQIVAFIKRIIEAIKSAFVRIGEWVVETYKRLTDAFVALERRAEKLAERVKSGKMKEGAIDNKHLASKLCVAGQPTTDVLAVLTNIANVAAYLNDPKAYKGYLEALDLCEEMVKNPEKEEEIKGKISEQLVAWAGELSKKAEKEYKPQGEEKSAVFLWLLGNQGLKVRLPSSTKDLGAFESTVTNIDASSDAATVEALDQAAAEKVCAKVIEVSKAVRESAAGSKGGVKELTTEIAKHKDTLNALLTAKLKDEQVGPAMRQIAVFINTIALKASSMPVHAINRALPRNLSVALDYVAGSIAMTQIDTGAKAAA